jgi:hypothetical protein
MFMCIVHQKSVNKLDLTWKQSFLIYVYSIGITYYECNLQLQYVYSTGITNDEHHL